jgi:hypothetical protein
VAIMKLKRSKPVVTITTIEGRRQATTGSLTAREYGSRRAQLVSKDTKVGKTRVSG